ncbi:MAG: hypothetical protein ACFFDS_02415 [Candidatus Thorarchaeota archaeon]
MKNIIEEIQTFDQISSSLSKYTDLIYGFFLGNKDGIIYKERIFNSNYCPHQILSNIVKAISTFAEDTKISKKGMIELSKSKISFVKIQDITYVLNHGLKEKKDADLLIENISSVFEEKSRAKFHSDDPEQVFSGASAVFEQTVDELFNPVMEYQTKREAEEAVTASVDEFLFDLELVGIPIQYDEIEVVTKERKKTDTKEDEKTTKEQKLSAVTFNILNSIGGIEHLVFINHEAEEASLFFENGKLEEKIVNKTLNACQKFLNEIVKMMKDEDIENAISVSEKYQIIFVSLNERNFMYAIATKDVDPVLLQPVFERIARRIKDVVLEYGKDK